MLRFWGRKNSDPDIRVTGMAKQWKGIDETDKEQWRQERRDRWYDRRELKRILLGHTHQNEQGRLTADRGAIAVNRFGVEDGAIQVYFLGITYRRKRYVTTLSDEEFLKIADDAMANIGRRVILEQLPQSPCVFRRFKLSVPALLYVEAEDGKVSVVTASGRAFSGGRSMRALRKAFEKEMRGNMMPLGKSDTKKSADKDSGSRK